MTPEEKRDLRSKIDRGLRAGIASALEEHRRAGRKVAIWRDGRVVQVLPQAAVPAEPSLVREEPPDR